MHAPSTLGQYWGGELGEALSPRSESRFKNGARTSCHCSRFRLCYPITSQWHWSRWATYSSRS